MSIVSVDNISPIGSGTSVTVNSAATLVLTNANIAGVTTASGGVRVNADGNTSANFISIGASDDLKLYHQGGNSIIQNSTGYLELNANAAAWIKTTQFNIIDNDATHYHIRTFKDDRVELYYNNSKKLETTSSGITLSDQLQVNGSVFASAGLKINADNQKLRLGASDDLELYHDGSDSFIKDTGTGALKVCSNLFRVNNAANTEAMIKAEENAGVTLSYDANTKFETMSTGARVQGGLLFNSDTAAANTLDDYEEGTYTPALTYDSSDSGNKTYQTRHGTYTKIGRVVTANFYVELSNKGNGNGAVAISLPFQVASILAGTSLEAGGVIHYFTGLVNSWSDITLSALDGLSRCRMYGISGQYGASTIGFEYSAMANTFNIRGSITYQST